MLNAHTFETLYLSPLVSPASKGDWNRERPWGTRSRVGGLIMLTERQGAGVFLGAHCLLGALHIIGNPHDEVVGEGFLQGLA